LHKQQIIYRDLKPENILMGEDGFLCLTDFGLAKILKPDEVTYSFCGTPEYLAPEIITEKGHGF
jgi:serine/threonine protein kinase